ncbi:MAG TPA: dodecin family protein [Gillisia sp.]|nr:dodecin family protein [Gillisia sp.]
MALIKVVEIMANSGKSWEDAAQNAVKQAAKTIKNIKSIYVNEQSAVVNGENITEYRVNLKISFEVHHEQK